MGLGLKLSKSSFDTNITNPDPKNYDILDVFTFNGWLFLEVKYIGCTNYEGIKILLFKCPTLKELLKKNKGVIDPHFSDNKEYYSPVARFEPTELGRRLADIIMRTKL